MAIVKRFLIAVMMISASSAGAQNSGLLESKSTSSSAPAAPKFHCEDFEVNENGVRLFAHDAAVQFSEREENDIAVVAFTGYDLDPDKAVRFAGKVTSDLAGELTPSEDDDLNTACFRGVHQPDKPSGFAFVINGFAFPPGTVGLNASELIENIGAAKGEAVLVRANGLKGKPEHTLTGLGKEIHPPKK